MNAILEHMIKIEDDGKTVETVLRRRFDVSSALMKFLKLNGKLRINGEVCRSVDIVKMGDILTADVEEEAVSENIMPKEMQLNIIYEDEFLLLINKPRNMSVHPSIGNFDNTLANGVIDYWQKNGEQHKFHAVNRLDKDTSGICIIAKNQFAHGVLCNQIKKNDLKKRYMAIVNGALKNNKGTIDMPIKREQEGILKRVTAKDGKRAVTHYTVVEKYEKYSLVDISLETGRTHQIRVHFSSIGHPLLGDWLYGNGDMERDIAKGHLLHAYYIGFYHPKTKEFMEFKLPLPKDMEECKLHKFSD